MVAVSFVEALEKIALSVFRVVFGGSPGKNADASNTTNPDRTSQYVTNIS